MIIGFTGHRDCRTSFLYLNDIFLELPGAVWIHGGAIGFDAQVKEFIDAKNIPNEVLRPDYARYGPKVAPLRRNDEIVRRADLLVACYDGRTRGGTMYTINRAKEKGIPIVLLSPVRMTDVVG